MPQDPSSLLFRPTVRAEIAETLRLLGRPDDGAVESWLDALGLQAVADRHPRSLSGGERQRVAIAAVAVGGATVLLLDEPTRGMDAASRAALERAIATHRDTGGAVVLATHDVELAARCATRATVLGDGEVVASGDAREVLTGSLFAPQIARVVRRLPHRRGARRHLGAGMSAVVARPVAPALLGAVAARAGLRARRDRRRRRVPVPVLVSRPSRSRTSRTAATRPLWAGIIGALALTALALELRRGTMTGMTVAVLGVLAATGGLLRLVSLPLGGNGIFFVVILVGVAFGPRFGLLLGMCAMAVSAVITGGIGPWLPFQMLGTGAMGASAGWLGRATVHLRPRTEVAVVAAFGWCWGFLYGAVLNLWFWPFQRDGGELSWIPGSSVGSTLHHYWSFYVATSYPWTRRPRSRTPCSSCSRAARSSRRCAGSPTGSTRSWSSPTHARHRRVRTGRHALRDVTSNPQTPAVSRSTGGSGDRRRAVRRCACATRRRSRRCVSCRYRPVRTASSTIVRDLGRRTTSLGELGERLVDEVARRVGCVRRRAVGAVARRCRDPGVHRARAQRGHADRRARARELAGQALREREPRELRRRVRRGVRRREDPRGRDRVHHVPRPTPLDHPGHERLDAVQDPVEVHAHHPGEVGDGLGPERAAGEDARVVAQQVGTAELRVDRAASARTDAASATSVSTAIASTPVSATSASVAASGPASMSAAATRMPSTAQATANARPMPLAGARDHRRRAPSCSMRSDPRRPAEWADSFLTEPFIQL